MKTKKINEDDTKQLLINNSYTAFRYNKIKMSHIGHVTQFEYKHKIFKPS